jgi:hypothetical protein
VSTLPGAPRGRPAVPQHTTAHTGCIWLHEACVSLDLRANAGVSFARSDFKLRIRAPSFCLRLGYYFRERIRHIRIKFQMSSNCHFGSLNLVRNSNLESNSCIRSGQLKERNSSACTYSWILPSSRAVFARHHTLALSPLGLGAGRPRFGC